MKGILVIGHGSRANGAKEVFEQVVRGIEEKMVGKKIEGCFMEISNPQIPETIDKMYAEGVRDITVLPYFLFPGVHILKDIPEILGAAREKHSGLSIDMASPIGYHSKLIDILVERAEGEVDCI